MPPCDPVLACQSMPVAVQLIPNAVPLLRESVPEAPSSSPSGSELAVDEACDQDQPTADLGDD